MPVKSSQGTAALSISSSLASRLSTMQSVAGAATGYASVDDMNGLNGAAAVAMLHASLDRCNGSSGSNVTQVANLAHTFIVQAVSDPGFEDMGLFNGWSGIALAIRYVGACNGSYGNLLRSIRNNYAAGVLADLRGRDVALESSHEYEWIQGYAGGYVLLDPGENHEAVAMILDLFDWLTADTTGSRWKLRNVFDRTRVEPLNLLGVSHGLAGLLAALTCKAKIDREFVIMERIGAFLLRCVQKGRYGPQWGYALTDPADAPSRVAWCHGSLGIASCLWSAGEILGNSEFRDCAVSSLLGIAEMPMDEWGMRDFSLCHGVAGNAILLHRLGRLTNESLLKRIAHQLTDMVINGFNDSLRLGYEPVLFNQPYSDPGLLNGAVGVALALLTATDLLDESWLEILGMKQFTSA